MTFTLPLPPSANAYWRSIVRGKRAVVLTSKEGRQYQEHAGTLLVCKALQPIDGPVGVEARFFFKANRGDLDNRIKPLLDVLEGHCFANDEQIEHLTAIKSVDPENPRVEVTVFPLEVAA